jgi:hypothetical protein
MVQKKRKQGSGNRAASKRQKQDGQKALSKDINIPIDEGFKENGKLVFLIQSQSWRPPQQFSSPPSTMLVAKVHLPAYAWPNQKVELRSWEARLTPYQLRWAFTSVEEKSSMMPL